MCELLGMSFNVPIRPRFTFSGFCRRGKNNPDGWGLAFYPDKGNASLVIKEPGTASQSKLSGFLCDYELVKSRIFVAHVRRSSQGGVSYRNTHPFSRELQGREYVFAHNGTLKEYKNSLNLGRFQPLGQTDSEYAFCYLLAQLEIKSIHKWGLKGF